MIMKFAQTSSITNLNNCFEDSKKFLVTLLNKNMRLSLYYFKRNNVNVEIVILYIQGREIFNSQCCFLWAEWCGANKEILHTMTELYYS